MKKISFWGVSLTLVVLFQLISIKSLATNIDESTARQYGAYYLSVMTGSHEATDAEISLAYLFKNPDLNIPAAYVFNVEKQGFVIVSGSDLWYPILGYSTEGKLDTATMAPAFRWYIEGLCNYIIYSQNTGTALIEDIEEEWDRLRYRKYPNSKSTKANTWLLKSKWGQGYPDTLTYNKYCPHKTVDSVEKTAYVGCVATAMSQIINYWKYPVRPVQDTIGYECTLDGEFYDSLCIDLDTVRYDYENMPIKLTSHSPQHKIDATALLCYHAGVSVEMNYGLSGSGAYSAKVPAALRDVFLFDTIIKWEARTIPNYEDYTEEIVYTNDEWAAILSTEITEGRPVYYRGHSRSGSGRDAGGHAFVCDGQHSTDSNLFHFNWGWDGQANVWCDVRNNSLQVGNFNFYFDQAAVTHAQPRKVDTVITDIPQVENILPLPYPNPTNSYIVIPYDAKQLSNIEMSVYNMEGRLIERVFLNDYEDAIVLDVRRYPKGLYIYKIGNFSRKFLIE